MNRPIIILFVLLSFCTAIPALATDRVKLETNMGDITITLDREKAPETVANFLKYVQEGFYDDTIFHRVIQGFMIQGGGFTPDMVQKKTGAAVKNEADNRLKNSRGTIAMARTSDPHSASSQFFINTVDNPYLDFQAKEKDKWGYTVFGHVTQGMDVVDKIERVVTTYMGMHENVPIKPVIIKKAVYIQQQQQNRTQETTAPDSGHK